MKTVRYFAFASVLLLLPAVVLAQASGGATGSASSHHSTTTAPTETGFDFRGLKTGMHKKDIESILGVVIYCHKGDAATSTEDESVGWLCLDGSDPRLEIELNGQGKLWYVAYHFKSGGRETPESFAAAFTTKYGKPVVKKKTYRNGLGNEVTGLEYAWQLGTQELRVDEICGKLDGSCVGITDVAYSPKMALPQI